MKLELYLPLPKELLGQPFGANENPLYAGQGLKGHTAQDWGFGYDQPVLNLANDAYCYSVMNKDNVDPMKYRAVFTLVPGDNGVSDLAEVSYGHAHNILAEVGRTYQPGEQLMTCGNTGDVYAFGVYVTREQKLAGSKAGAHLHGPQIRPVKRVTKRAAKQQYLTDANGYLKLDGNYFEVINYDNGYNGCIDAMPFYNGKVAGAAPVPPVAIPVFSRDLYFGIEGEDVRSLQKYLNAKGFPVSKIGAGSPGNESTVFAAKTQAALINFQKAKGIKPASGYFGPITRAYIANNP